MKRCFAYIAVGLLAAAAMAQSSLDGELKAMQDAYNKENKAYMEAAMEKAKNGQAFDMSGGPAKNYLDKALALGRRARGSSTADRAYAWSVQMAYQTQDSGAIVQAIEGMIANNPNSKELKQSMPFIGFGVKPVETAVKLLSRIEYYSSEQETKAQALRMRAGLFYDEYSGDGDVDRAKDILQRTVDKYPGTEAANRAKNTLFALDNLGIGKVAPDFNAVDENGVSYKLSDYRGKVVVVDFWGFW